MYIGFNMSLSRRYKPRAGVYDKNTVDILYNDDIFGRRCEYEIKHIVQKKQ